jgi:phosphate ABC transporter phosphate-binding protein
MTVEYNFLKPHVRLNYQSIGSGGGIRQHTAKTVDFAASDAPLNDEQRAVAPDTVHIPVTIGAVTLTYNLPGVGKGLRVSGPLIADIFLGKVKKWNEPAITSLNPDLQLPEADILVVHRSDGSGTTFVWTSYLSLVSPGWSDTVGRGTAVQWPTGLGSSGNEGVAGLIRGTPYSVGYVELAYAHQNQMTYAAVQNREGRFVEPTLESTGAAAAETAGTLPSGDESWTSVHLLNTPGEDSYGIASFSYLLVYRELSVLPSMSEAKARALVDFLWWAIHEGQSYAARITYVPLPPSVVSINEETIGSIVFNGKPLVRR